MKIQIVPEKKGARPVIVDLPDALPGGVAADTAFPVEVDGRKYIATWNQKALVLMLLPREPATNGVQFAIPVRSMRATRFPGESETACDIECVLPVDPGPGVARTVRANAQRFIPGLTDSGTTDAGGPRGRAGNGMRSPVLRSQITGKVLSVLVKDGDIVEEGTPLLVIEAMKMENRIIAPARALVAGIKVKAGASVSTGDELLRLEAADQ